MRLLLSILLLIPLSAASQQMFMESDTVIYHIGENGSWRQLSKKQYSTSLSIYKDGRVVISQGETSLDMKTIGITVEDLFVRYDFQLNNAWFCILVQKDFSSYASYYRSCFGREECIEFMRVYPIRKIRHNR